MRAVTFVRPVETLYLGGGTPDFLSEKELSRLLAMLRSHVPLAVDAEISCELNPEALTPDKWELLHSFITRASLGVQSFSPAIREKLGRHCRQEHLERALELVRRNPPPHWNCDLIYGVAGSCREEWERDLRTAASVGADHLSCYALTAEENSRLGLAGTPALGEDEQADWWLRTGRLLAEAGLPRYEISNYARPGAECRHNRNVWRGETLLGLGPSAAGFDGHDRFTEPSSLERWLAGEPPEIDRIAPEHREAEIFAVNLRTAAGWTQEAWGTRRRRGWDFWLEHCARLARREPAWWIVAPERIALTEAGLLFWDSAAEELLPD